MHLPVKLVVLERRALIGRKQWSPGQPEPSSRGPQASILSAFLFTTTHHRLYTITNNTNRFRLFIFVAGRDAPNGEKIPIKLSQDYRFAELTGENDTSLFQLSVCLDKKEMMEERINLAIIDQDERRKRASAGISLLRFFSTSSGNCLFVCDPWQVQHCIRKNQRPSRKLRV